MKGEAPESVTKRFSARRSGGGASGTPGDEADDGTREFGGAHDPAAVRHIEGTVGSIDEAGRPVNRSVELRLKVNTDTQKGAPRPWDRVSGARPGATLKPNEGEALSGMPLHARASWVDGTTEFAGTPARVERDRPVPSAPAGARAPRVSSPDNPAPRGFVRARSEGARVQVTSARISEARRMMAAPPPEPETHALPYEQAIAWALAAVAVGLAILVAAT